MGNNPSTEQWQRLFDLAEQIKALKPWFILEEVDIFGVRDPETGVDHFVSVMGRGGEHFAVAVYHDAEALFQFWALNDPDFGAPPEMVLAIRQLQLSFEDRNDLHPSEINLIHSLQRKYRGKNAWPAFRSFLPGYLPWQIDASEASTLIYALEQTIDVVTRAAKNAELLEPPDDDTYLFRIPEVNGDTITWRDQLVKVKPPTSTGYEIPIKPELLDQVRKLPKRKKSSFDLDILPLPQPMQAESGRPYLPNVMLVVDSSSGMIVMAPILPPVVGLVETLLQIPQMLAEGLVKIGYVPGTIKVQNPMMADMAKFLQRVTGWKVKSMKELPMLEAAVDFLMSSMKADMMLEDDYDELDEKGLDEEELDEAATFGRSRGTPGRKVEGEPVRHRSPASASPAKSGKSGAPGKLKASKATQVYQLKITLKNIKPPIWRRVLVPDNLTLDQLHHVIQVAMGWYDAHLHEFNIGGLSYGSPDFDSDFASEVKDDATVRLNQVISKNIKRFRYTYDFGDDWEHVIEIEKVLPYDEGSVYPVCIAGKRSCPPEDVGGAWGYQSFLATISDPNDPEHEEMLEWVGGEFDPEEFDIEEVNEIFARMSRR